METRALADPLAGSRRSEFLAGMKATFPLIVGAIPFGIIFGAVAVTSGLSPASTAAMSAFVFAGSAQFVATGLVASGTGVALIVLTTFIVNLRHSLYAATLAPDVKQLPQHWLIPLGFWLTDETFLVVAERFKRDREAPFRHWFFLGSALFMYTNWQLCTYIGIRAGEAIPEPRSWGLDFALPVTFIGMLTPMLVNRPTAAAVAVATTAALLLHGLPNQLGLICAVLGGVAAGYLFDRRRCQLPDPGSERGP
ncbi:MAG: AzlC family ABC transporter permease [Caldilineaceae bacterium]|nr:AzlC family ABC transporter permease [Caldilineaceae bacterium]